MSIFGNIQQNGVFSGFGKPYIKLEFDDNTALLDFQKRMNESGEAQESEFEDGEFRPIEGGEVLSHDDFFNIITQNPASNMDFLQQTEENIFKLFPYSVYDSNNKKFYVLETPLKDEFKNVFLSAQRLRKHIKNSQKHKNEHAWAYIKQTLKDPNLIYKYNNAYVFLKPFLTAEGKPFILYLSPIALNDTDEHEKGEVLSMYIKDKGKKERFENLYNQYIQGGGQTVYSRAFQSANTKSPSNLNGVKGEVCPFVVDFRLYCDKVKIKNSDNQIFDKKNLGAPGDVYLVTDTREKPRKDLDEIKAFKKIDIEKFNVNALKALQDSDPLLYEEIKAGIGKTANPYLYNNNEIIDCRGLKPTYKILDNYDNFFDVADSKTSFVGFGLTDTKKLISETCRAHWKDCKKIAAHLKGDSLLQSCFNLWHWLRFNIRYEYDKEGREEIRTPLRVWQDRARGVDCDCLSVFSWCVLRCMGYDPVFELVAFKNRPQFSHIFINCDGVVVDRVWFVFNSRPPLVTKRELFRVDLINNLGQLF